MKYLAKKKFEQLFTAKLTNMGLMDELGPQPRQK